MGRKISFWCLALFCFSFSIQAEELEEAVQSEDDLHGTYPFGRSEAFGDIEDKDDLLGRAFEIPEKITLEIPYASPHEYRTGEAKVYGNYPGRSTALTFAAQDRFLVIPNDKETYKLVCRNRRELEDNDKPCPDWYLLVAIIQPSRKNENGQICYCSPISNFGEASETKYAPAIYNPDLIEKAATEQNIPEEAPPSPSPNIELPALAVASATGNQFLQTSKKTGKKIAEGYPKDLFEGDHDYKMALSLEDDLGNLVHVDLFKDGERVEDSNFYVHKKFLPEALKNQYDGFLKEWKKTGHVSEDKNADSDSDTDKSKDPPANEENEEEDSEEGFVGPPTEVQAKKQAQIKEFHRILQLMTENLTVGESASLINMLGRSGVTTAEFKKKMDEYVSDDDGKGSREYKPYKKCWRYVALAMHYAFNIKGPYLVSQDLAKNSKSDLQRLKWFDGTPLLGEIAIDENYLGDARDKLMTDPGSDGIRNVLNFASTLKEGDIVVWKNSVTPGHIEAHFKESGKDYGEHFFYSDYRGDTDPRGSKSSIRHMKMGGKSTNTLYQLFRFNL